MSTRTTTPRTVSSAAGSSRVRHALARLRTAQIRSSLASDRLHALKEEQARSRYLSF